MWWRSILSRIACLLLVGSVGLVGSCTTAQQKFDSASPNALERVGQIRTAYAQMIEFFEDSVAKQRDLKDIQKGFAFHTRNFYRVVKNRELVSTTNSHQLRLDSAEDRKEIHAVIGSYIVFLGRFFEENKGSSTMLLEFKTDLVAVYSLLKQVAPESLVQNMTAAESISSQP